MSKGIWAESQEGVKPSRTIGDVLAPIWAAIMGLAMILAIFTVFAAEGGWIDKDSGVGGSDQPNSPAYSDERPGRSSDVQGFLDNSRSLPDLRSGSGSCNSSSYRNVDGNCVRRPSVSSQGGASARCSDGTYSFSQNRSGTCSGHGGVSSWNP